MNKSFPHVIIFALFIILYAPGFNVLLQLLLDTYPKLAEGEGVLQTAIAFLAFNTLTINLLTKYVVIKKEALNYVAGWLCIVFGMCVHYLIIDVKQTELLQLIYGTNLGASVLSIAFAVWLKKSQNKSNKQGEDK